MLQLLTKLNKTVEQPEEVCFPNMGALRNFRKGGGASLKRLPPWRKKLQKSPPHGEKIPHNEKNVAKRPPYEEKLAKRPFSRGGSRRKCLLLPPLAGARVAKENFDFVDKHCCSYMFNVYDQLVINCTTAARYV